MTLAERIEALHYVILGALARAARDDDGIKLACGVRQRGFHQLGPVGQNAEIYSFGASRLDQTVQHRRVGVVDLARGEAFAGTQDLVSGGKDGRL